MSNSPTLSQSEFLQANTAQWKTALQQALVDLRVSIPAIVQSVNYDNNPPTVTVQVAIKEVEKTPEGPKIHVISPIANVPIVLPSAGGFSLTLPVAAGDEGLLVFCDMCIDLWWTRGGVQDQLLRCRHDISDCGFIPGMRSQAKPIPNWSQNTAQLRTDDGTAYLELTKEGAINIVAPGGFNVNGVATFQKPTTFEDVVTAEEEIVADGGLELGAGASLSGDGGTLEIVGDVVGSGTGTFAGVGVSTHLHGGVTTGTGATGLPVG